MLQFPEVQLSYIIKKTGAQISKCLADSMHQKDDI
jgi:hypothetical protein